MPAPDIEHKRFPLLLNDHWPALVLYAKQWQEESPEDVVQDALISLMEQHAFPENPVGWLYRAVRNGAISASRRQQSRVRHERECAKQRQAWFESDPLTQVNASQARQLLQDLALPVREVVVLRIWGGLTFEQIAEVAGTSCSTAHRNFDKAIGELRRKWSDACRETN